MNQDEQGFQNVTKDAPCEHCGHPDWCARSKDGQVAICRREVDGPSVRYDRNGAPYTVHRHGDQTQVFTHRPASPRPEPAPVEARDRVYRELLTTLGLSEEHRYGLVHDRCFPQGDPDYRGYASLMANHNERGEAVQRLVKTLGHDALRDIPGFYWTDSRHDCCCGPAGYWTLGGSPGLLIPFRDIEGRILGLKIRLDTVRPDQTRYNTLTSTKHGGPGPGSPAHVPLPHPDGRDPEVVRLTEGELKADVCTALDPGRILTISAPGVTNWRVALPVLRALHPRVVQLALDQDSKTNPRVAGALLEANRELEKEGYEVLIEQWSVGKGLDDYFAAHLRGRHHD